MFFDGWYYAVAALMLIGGALLLDERVPLKVCRWAVALAFVVLYGISAMRQGLGSDWHAYELAYHSTVTRSETYFETGFAMLMSLCRSVGLSHAAFQAIAALPLLLLPLLLPRFKERDGLLLGAFFFATAYVVALGGVRQAIAAVFVIPAIWFWLSSAPGRWQPGAGVLALVGAQFHLSALPFALLAARTRVALAVVLVAAVAFAASESLRALVIAQVPSLVVSLVDDRVNTAQRDLLVLAERAGFVVLAIMAARTHRDSSFFRRLLVLELVMLVGFVVISEINRNLIGRMLIYTRLFDYFCFFGLPSTVLRVAAVAGYCLLKVHFTYATTGFYDP